MYLSLIFIVGGVSLPCLKTLVFLRLMVNWKSEHADKNWLNSVCRSWAPWALSSSSSEKGSSYTVIFFTFCFAVRHAGFYRHSLNLVCLTPTIDEQKVYFNSIERKIPKSVGARTQPCCTPLFIVNESEMSQSYCRVAFVLMWIDFTLLKRLRVQPILNIIAYNPSLLTRLKALVRTMKAIYKGTFCFLHFSCSCCTKKSYQWWSVKFKYTLQLGIYYFGQLQ